MTNIHTYGYIIDKLVVLEKETNDIENTLRKLNISDTSTRATDALKNRLIAIDKEKTAINTLDKDIYNEYTENVAIMTDMLDAYLRITKGTIDNDTIVECWSKDNRPSIKLLYNEYVKADTKIRHIKGKPVV